MYCQSSYDSKTAYSYVTLAQSNAGWLTCGKKPSHAATTKVLSCPIFSILLILLFCRSSIDSLVVGYGVQHETTIRKMDADTEVTIVITWVFTWLAEALMALRLLMRKLRKQDFNISDYFTIAAMAFLIVRLAMVHVVLIWGTNNLTAAYRESHTFTAQEIYQLEIGSKLTLAVRAVYNV